MPWEQRGKRRYYYRAVRIAGRPRRTYVGTGIVAEMAAAADQQRRLQRQRQREEWEAAVAEINQTTGPIAELNEDLELLTRAAFLTAGFHQHVRGQWRRRRHAKHAPEAE